MKYHTQIMVRSLAAFIALLAGGLVFFSYLILQRLTLAEGPIEIWNFTQEITAGEDLAGVFIAEAGKTISMGNEMFLYAAGAALLLAIGLYLLTDKIWAIASGVIVLIVLVGVAFLVNDYVSDVDERYLLTERLPVAEKLFLEAQYPGVVYYDYHDGRSLEDESMELSFKTNNARDTVVLFYEGKEFVAVYDTDQYTTMKKGDYYLIVEKSEAGRFVRVGRESENSPIS